MKIDLPDLQKAVWLCTTPRVGQNAVLGSLRHVIPGAGEWGDAHPYEGILITSVKPWYELAPAEETFYIVIQRRDKVAQAVSWEYAARTARFHSWQSADNEEPPYSQEAIRTGIAAIEQQQQQWVDLLRDKEHLSLVYEDDIEGDPTEAAQRILDYCGIDGRAGPTDVSRFSSDAKREWIERFRRNEFISDR